VAACLLQLSLHVFANQLLTQLRYFFLLYTLLTFINIPYRVGSISLLLPSPRSPFFPPLTVLRPPPSQLITAMDRVAGGAGQGRVVSLLEGGYDTLPQTLGLARCVDAHVRTLRRAGLDS
jgi:hypothetical protein